MQRAWALPPPKSSMFGLKGISQKIKENLGNKFCYNGPGPNKIIWENL